MGRSFYTGSYNELYAGSNSFTTQIVATPVAFGLTSAQATSYQTLNDTYAAAWQAASVPNDRSPVKTQARNDAAIPLTAMAKQLADIINGTPTVTNDQKLALGLSVRATPTPVTGLGTPNKQKVALNGDGSLDLSWQCSSPRGTGMTYQVWRKLSTDANYIYLGGTGEKKWNDATIPAGTAQAVYKIQAVRSTAQGPWAVFTVTFGTSSSGAVTASVKLAA